MKKPILKSFVLIYLIFAGTLLSAQDLLTLEEAIRIGLENNYSIKIAKNESKILSNNQHYGKYAFLPVVTGNAYTTYDVQNIEQQSFQDSIPTVVNNAKSDQLGASVDLEWTIFNGLGMFISYEKLQEIEKAGEFTLMAEVERTIAEISKAYYQIILERQKVAVLENTVGLSEKRMEIAEATYEVGRSSKLEYLSAQVDLNTDKSALISQKEEFRNAKINLNRILGRAVETAFEITAEIQTTDDLELSLLREDLLAHNPSLQTLQTRKEISALTIREIRAERFPEINVNAGYSYTNAERQLGFASTNISDGYYYGLSASVNIFNGLNISRRIQNATIQEENNELLYQQLQTDLLAALNSYYIAYQNALRLSSLEAQNLEIAKENEAIAYDRYRLGNSDFLEFREAQRNAVEAESRLIDARFSTKIAEIELLRLSGNIMENKDVR